MRFYITSLIIHISIIFLIFYTSSTTTLGDRETDLSPMTVTLEVQSDETQINIYSKDITIQEEQDNPEPEPVVTSENQIPLQINTKANKTNKSKQQSKARSQYAAGTNNSQTDRVHANWKRRIKPLYPPEALKQHHVGIVRVLVHINELGVPVSATIIQSSESVHLDAAAKKAALSSMFFPRLLNNTSQGDTLIIPYYFDIVH
jgi:TonB family protein